MSVPEPGLIVCGRSFTPEDLARIREIISAEPPPCRQEIARRTCEVLNWVRPDGRLKEMSCRVALLRLDSLGLVKLPPPRRQSGNRKPYQPALTLVEPANTLVCPVQQLSGLRIRAVESPKDSQLWNEAVSRFHYLGYKRLPGAQIRYLIEAEEGLLSVLGFGASAWKVAPRDRWIGWSEEQRKRRLHFVVNNARFLILPWVRSENLGSWALSRCARRLPSDWEERYGYRPVLLETFIERHRFQGSCYKAANWKYLGDTQGRGKLDRRRRYGQPVKQIYVYPLTPEFRRLLCAGALSGELEVSTVGGNGHGQRRWSAMPAYDPSVDRQELSRLQAEFSRILGAFCAHEPLVQGSLQTLRRCCGKERCRCQHGELHESLVLVERSSGKRKIRKVIVGEQLKLEKPTGRYQSLKRLRVRLSKLHREVLACCDRLCEHRLREGRRMLS